MSKEKTIVVLGGGIGGIVTARELRRHLGNQHRIILIDKHPVFAFSPSFLWLMIGWRTPETIQRSLILLEKHGIEFRLASVEEIETDRKTIRTNHGTLGYDYLVIALGADITPQDIPGLSESGNTFYTLGGAVELYAALREFNQQQIAIVISGLPYKCPPAPYEAAFLIESFFSRKGDTGKKIGIYTPEPSPLGIAGDSVGERLRSLLQERGISLSTGKKIRSVDAMRKKMFFDDGTDALFDFLIAVPPHQAPVVLHKAGLTDESGWIPVDPRILRTTIPDVYAIGDATRISLQNGSSLPKAGIIAANQAEVVASVIAFEINRHGFPKEFTGAGFCFVETGNGRAGYISGNFYGDSTAPVQFHEPSVTYHWGKVVFEKYWLWRWF